MRFTAQLRVWLPGTVVRRAPTFWESIRSAFGASVDLQSDELRTTREALAFAEGLQACLAGAGVTNAVSLVVDRSVIYYDTVGRPDDAHWMVRAARANAALLMSDFGVLRAVFEHDEGGVHTVIEATFRARYRAEEPAAVIAFGGRVNAVRPWPGESQDVARARVEALVGDPYRTSQVRWGFDALVARVRDGLVRLLPEARFQTGDALAQLVRPSRRSLQGLARGPLGGRAPALHARPHPARWGAFHHHYDPWDAYYDDPDYTWAELVALDAVVQHQEHVAAWPFPIHVLREDGVPICEADAIAQSADAFRGLHDAACYDYSTAGPAPEVFACYAPDEPLHAHPTWASDDVKPTSTDAVSTDCSWGKDSSTDCVSSDCAKSDCSTDCSWDCAKSDCSTDCSWDCAKSDCSSDCSSDG